MNLAVRQERGCIRDKARNVYGAIGCRGSRYVCLALKLTLSGVKLLLLMIGVERLRILLLMTENLTEIKFCPTFFYQVGETFRHLYFLSLGRLYE